jgi:hypothetical protein
MAVVYQRSRYHRQIARPSGPTLADTPLGQFDSEAQFQAVRVSIFRQALRLGWIKHIRPARGRRAPQYEWVGPGPLSPAWPWQFNDAYPKTAITINNLS